jgi:DinB family protein
MQGTELYADLIATLAQRTRKAIGKLSAEELAWQPDAEGNSIGVTVWHVARWIDVTNRVLRDKPPSEEFWLTRGWAERTGYNPQGIGTLGLGAVTGYTLQEVGAIPRLSAEELLTYLDQSCEALQAYLLALPSFEPLRETVPESSSLAPWTKAQMLKDVFMGVVGHTGEIDALKAIMKRASVA